MKRARGIDFVAGVALLVCALQPSIASAQARTRLVQSVDMQVPVAPTPVRIAGTRYLAYELHVTNFRSFDIALNRLEVRNAARDGTLADFRNPQLASMVGLVGNAPDESDRRIVRSGMRSVIYLWLPLEEKVETPAGLRHRIELDLLRPSGSERAVIDGGILEIGRTSPVALSPPLRGGPWVALYDPTMVGGHRTSIYTLDGQARIPARFAIDFVRLEADGTHARGDDDTIGNWYGYGAHVLAVADGTVVAALDDLSEAALLSGTTESISLENASGNHVALDIGGGRYAFYEHLKHGSVTVKRGDRVKRGQVIAQLGNSGSSSSGPHLHFHVGDSAHELSGEGVPFVFGSFEVVGAFDSIAAFAAGGGWREPSTAGGARRQELPAANTVLLFPAQ
jgi:murein DD-endopeptidase